MVWDIQPKPALVAVVMSVLAASDSAAGADYAYSAQLQRSTRVSGKVVALGVSWECNKLTCTTSGPWLQPSPIACAALAKKVGAIVSYGRPGAMLSPGQLAMCNGAAQLTENEKAASSGPGSQSANRASKGKGEGVPVKEASGATCMSVKCARATVLTISGTGALPSSVTPMARAVRTEPLTITGTGALTTSPGFKPRFVRTETLEITGRVVEADGGRDVPPCASVRCARATTLTVSGTGELPASEVFVARAVRTEPLTITGTGALTTLPLFKPRFVRTQTLEITGAR